MHTQNTLEHNYGSVKVKLPRLKNDIFVYAGKKQKIQLKR